MQILIILQLQCCHLTWLTDLGMQQTLFWYQYRHDFYKYKNSYYMSYIDLLFIAPFNYGIYDYKL